MPDDLLAVGRGSKEPGGSAPLGADQLLLDAADPPDRAHGVDRPRARDGGATGQGPGCQLVVDREGEHHPGRWATDVARVDADLDREVEGSLQEDADHSVALGVCGPDAEDQSLAVPADGEDGFVARLMRPDRRTNPIGGGNRRAIDRDQDVAGAQDTTGRRVLRQLLDDDDLGNRLTQPAQGDGDGLLLRVGHLSGVLLVDLGAGHALGEQQILGHDAVGLVQVAGDPFPHVDPVVRAAQHRDRGEVQGADGWVGGLALDRDHWLAAGPVAQGVDDRARLEDDVGQVNHAHEGSDHDPDEHRNDPPTRTSAHRGAQSIGHVALMTLALMTLRVDHGVPTHSSLPSSKTWCFQIGTIVFTVSTSSRHTSNAVPRWAALTATTTARSPISR